MAGLLSRGKRMLEASAIKKNLDQSDDHLTIDEQSSGAQISTSVTVASATPQKEPDDDYITIGEQSSGAQILTSVTEASTTPRKEPEPMFATTTPPCRVGGDPRQLLIDLGYGGDSDDNLESIVDLSTPTSRFKRKRRRVLFDKKVLVDHESETESVEADFVNQFDQEVI